MFKRYIGIKELSEYLDTPVKTIRYWITMRKIPYYKFGKLVKFDLQEIDKWAEERKVKEFV